MQFVLALILQERSGGGNQLDMATSGVRNNNPLQTEHKSRTGEYWPVVIAVWTEHSEVRTKNDQGPLPVFPSIA